MGTSDYCQSQKAVLIALAIGGYVAVLLFFSSDNSTFSLRKKEQQSCIGKKYSCIVSDKNGVQTLRAIEIVGLTTNGLFIYRDKTGKHFVMGAQNLVNWHED